MRIGKKGNVKLQRGDIRVGNFVIHTEKEHYKIQDIAGVFAYRVAMFTNAGMMMSVAVDNMRKGDKESEGFLANYCAVMFNVLCCVPDAEYFKDLNDAAIACVSRHKDMYGYGEEISEERDAEILNEEKELSETEEEARKEVFGE